MRLSQHRINILVVAAALATLCLAAACREEGNPPVGPGDSTRYPPTGMPNWNDPRYDWIDLRDSACFEFDITRSFWFAKFGFSVSDISPDGTRLLLRRGGELLLFDTATHSVRSIFQGPLENAAWSNNERFIACVRYPHGEPVVIDLQEDRWYDLPYPDSLGLFGAGIRWLPNDSSVVIIAGGKTPQTPSGHFAIDIHPPYTVRRVNIPKISAYTFKGKQGYYLAIARNDGKGIYDVDLRIGAIGDTVDLARYSLPGVTGYYHMRTSKDGNWLMAHIRADIRGSRFTNYLKSYKDIHALGVVDMRPGSPTQYKLFRVFPDYTEDYRNCAEGYFDAAGAISPDGRYIYHERVKRSDSTTQIVKLNVVTGQAEEISNFLTSP